jgi:Trpc4-associated protein
MQYNMLQSSVRFWICRAVEAFLRARSNPADQVFLLRRGLLQHLLEGVGQLVAVGDNTTLQATMDLIGELVRFNAEVCAKLDETAFHRRCVRHVITTTHLHLVDCNLFLRELVLAADYFHTPRAYTLKSGAVVQLTNYGAMTQTLSGFVMRDYLVSLASKLVVTIASYHLNNETTSCLNTLIVRPCYKFKKHV